MTRFGLFCLLFVCAACGNGNNKTAATTSEEPEAESYERFDQLFAKKDPPYELYDTSLASNKDTTQIRLQAFVDLVPDSLRTEIFGAKAKVRYSPLARFDAKNTTYYLVKGQSGSKRAALLAVAEGQQFKTLLPFLVPDNDASTNQQSLLDKNFSVSRTTTQKTKDDVLAEGKDVFAYSKSSGRFELIMTDPLEDDLELINPIDTLARTHKLAGDYSRDKKNIVSVRDGRKQGLLTVFIHIEKNKGACTGEIKGDVQITSPTTAMYRQPGDPCVLNLKFSKNSVTLEEEEGCGARRGLECSFNGTFTRKKESKEKKAAEKK